MKKRIIIGVIVVLVLGASAILVWGKLFGKGGNDPLSSIQTATVMRGDITVSVDATGTIEPLVIVEVRCKASGAITKLVVEEGDSLKAGDLIAEIEKTYTQADVDKAKADLNSARARLVQAQMNIELQKEQSKIQIKQARDNVLEAETRLAQLREDIELEKEANARQVKEAENDLAMAKLRLEQAQNSRPESVKRSEASVTQSKVSLDLAEEEYKRQKALHEKNFVSRSEVDSAKAKLDSAQAQYESALEQLKMTKEPSSEEELKLAKLSVTKSELSLEAAKHKQKQETSREKDLKLSESQLEDTRSALELALANEAQIKLKEKDLEAAQASVLRSEVALKEAQDRLADTIVKAPISGTILQKNVEEGQVITSSMGATAAAGTLLVTMADLENVYVKTEVDETDIGKVKPGQSVTITVDAFPDMSFDGTVLRIAPQGRAVQNVTTFEVTTEIKNPSRILKPGMNASVEIHAVDIRDVLVVENEAIMDMRGRKMVIPVVDGQLGQPVTVEVGERGWDTTEIIFGLEEGEEVLVMTPGQSDTGIPDFIRQRMSNPMESFRRMNRSGGPGGPGPGGPPPR
jgi:HlyD family secretion protein